MPLQLGRNPKSYPANDKFREGWDRMFGKDKKPVEATSAAELLAKMSGAKAFVIDDGEAPKIFEDIRREGAK